MTKDITSDHLLDYVRGNLSPDMCEKVEAACENDKDFAEELAYYKGLTYALSKDRPKSDERQWQRLSRAIDDASTPLETPFETPFETPLGTKTPANDTGRVWRWAACVLGVLLIGQTAITSIKSSQSENDNATYVTVTQTEQGNSLQISFVPLATEVDIRTLLLDVDAKIVSGPSALGIYVLGFQSETDQDTALGILSEKSDIVETVSKN